MDLGLKGKRALVTGASQASAAPAPRRWREKAAISSWRRASARGLEVAKVRSGKKYTASTSRSTARLAQPGNAARLAQECGTADILINNAGNTPRAP